MAPPYSECICLLVVNLVEYVFQFLEQLKALIKGKSFAERLESEEVFPKSLWVIAFGQFGATSLAYYRHARQWKLHHRASRSVMFPPAF
jgi:hypothetical protein